MILHDRITSRIDRWFGNHQLPLGQRGELLAERYVLCEGLFVVERNHTNWFGEIDLIGVDDRTIVFFEVKTRKDDRAGMPYEAVDDAKQAKIIKTATCFLKKNQLLECQFRFDVISILWPQNERPALEHYVSAFEPADCYQLY